MKDIAYRLVNGKYIPVGYFYDNNVLSTGVWAVENSEKGLSITNVSFIQELCKGINISTSKKIDAYKLAENILSSPEYSDLIRKPFTMQHLVTFIISKVYELNK